MSPRAVLEDFWEGEGGSRKLLANVEKQNEDVVLRKGTKPRG